MTVERKIRVLIIDDNQHIREMVQSFLIREGYEYSSARDADQAIEFLRQGEYDLAIMDIVMPGRTGTDLLPQVVSEYPNMAVIMMSSIIDTTTAVTAMKEGAYDYITKPVDLEELAMRIEKALERRSLTIQNRRYQQTLEHMVNASTERLEQRMREITALNNLFQSHLQQVLGAQEAYVRLQTAIAEFSGHVDDLARSARIVSEDDRTLRDDKDQQGDSVQSSSDEDCSQQ
ncbi:MAG: response regulator [Chloroflexi bacterium]|nr:response regulator [Chloroflexota bacterium]